MKKHNFTNFQIIILNFLIVFCVSIFTELSNNKLNNANDIWNCIFWAFTGSLFMSFFEIIWKK